MKGKKRVTKVKKKGERSKNVMEKDPKEGNKKTEKKKSTNYKIRCQKCISNYSCVREIVLIDLKNPVTCYFQEINIRIERAMLKIKVWEKY